MFKKIIDKRIDEKLKLVVGKNLKTRYISFCFNPFSFLGEPLIKSNDNESTGLFKRVEDLEEKIALLEKYLKIEKKTVKEKEFYQITKKQND